MIHGDLGQINHTFCKGVLWEDLGLSFEIYSWEEKGKRRGKGRGKGKGKGKVKVRYKICLDDTHVD